MCPLGLVFSIDQPARGGHPWAPREPRGIMHVSYREINGSDRRVVRKTRMTPNRTLDRRSGLKLL
jgi:hypothetical protein